MKTLLVVPVYNGEPIIQTVVKELLESTNLPLLVVDDGSNPPLHLAPHSHLHLMRLENNQGKGAAIQAAFNWAIDKDFSHILTFDGDGQHRREDIPKMLEASQKNPEALIVGARTFDSSVPGVSRFGREFSNYWVRYQTGVSVSDSQSGLRIYPLASLGELQYFTKRYDFEIEVMVRGLWRGLSVVDVQVGVIYAPKEERLSHFNKLWDNIRITLLNIYLIAYSLIFYKRGLGKVIMAGAIAFSASLIPSLGWALFMGLLACVLLKVNVVVFTIAFLFLQMT